MIKRRNYRKNIYIDKPVELVTQLELIGKTKSNLIENITVENLKIDLLGKSYFNCVFKKCTISGLAEIIERCVFFDCKTSFSYGKIKINNCILQ